MTSTTPTTASNSRTAFSMSTATSLSGGSPQLHQQQIQLESALAAQKEKHTLEMEALLKALADSQQSSTILKGENALLRHRVQELEQRVAELSERVEISRRSPYQTSLNVSRSLMNHQRPVSVESFSKRPLRLHSFTPGNGERQDDFESRIAVREPSPMSSRMLQQHDQTIIKRSSIASSIFPAPPSNMALLMHEDGYPGEASLFTSSVQGLSRPASPGSPSRQSPRTEGGAATTHIKHGQKRSVSSIGSILSTSVDINASVPGSPGSLHLRPEHERHLGDMMSLDLSVVDSD